MFSRERSPNLSGFVSCSQQVKAMGSYVDRSQDLTDRHGQRVNRLGRRGPATSVDPTGGPWARGHLHPGFPPLSSFGNERARELPKRSACGKPAPGAGALFSCGREPKRHKPGWTPSCAVSGPSGRCQEPGSPESGCHGSRQEGALLDDIDRSAGVPHLSTVSLRCNAKKRIAHKPQSARPPRVNAHVANCLSRRAPAGEGGIVRSAANGAFPFFLALRAIAQSRVFRLGRSSQGGDDI